MSNSIINAFETAPPEVPPSRGVDVDFEQSRKNLIEVMAVTRGAIQNLSIIAFQSQLPDAYDVLNKLIKEYAGQQSQLLQMYRMKGTQEASREPKPADVIDNRTQNLFVGTPAELMKALEAHK